MIFDLHGDSDEVGIVISVSLGLLRCQHYHNKSLKYNAIVGPMEFERVSNKNYGLEFRGNDA